MFGGRRGGSVGSYGETCVPLFDYSSKASSRFFRPPSPNFIRSALACMFRSSIGGYAPRVAAMNEVPRGKRYGL